MLPQFLIERDIPGAGSLGDADCTTIARRSNDVLRELGPSIRWVHTYVTGDRMYCIYDAPNEEIIREHASRGGFPADQIVEVRRVIDPTTGSARSSGDLMSAT